MGYPVLHIDKAKENDSAMTAHIARTFMPSNVNSSRTHLNRELVQFPANVTNRTEAIEHRIATAGIYRKVAQNQIKALRFILSSSPEDMARIEQERRLYEWCAESIDWLRTTFGADNVVAATLHADEDTPHIHATVIPIVTGERRKAKEEAENGKRKYKTKKNKVRLCADDVLTPKKLEQYQTDYAKRMERFGLERGVQGSVARHRSTMEYYKEILKSTKEKEVQKAELTAKIKELEKQAGKLRMKGTLYSIFGNSELDKAEQRIADLEQEAEQQRYCSEREKAEIRKEVVLLQDTVKGRDKAIADLRQTVEVYEEERNWIKRFFNGFYQLLNIRLMLRKMNFSDDRIAEMYRTEAPQRGTAKAYSGLYKREFTEEGCEIRIAKDEKKRPLLTINGLPVTDWCEQKWKQLINRNRSQRL